MSALLESVERELAGWQPIASAPEDQDLLVFCPDAKEPHIIVAALVTFAGDDYDLTEWTDVWQETNLDVEPTHWMPLPERPA